MNKTGGGKATASGMDYQHRVAAWVAAHILAEKEATLPWDLPSGTTLEWLRCETEQPVDDLLVGTSGKGLVFAQVKRTLQLSNNPESDLASAFGQFVRQFIASQAKNTGPLLWDRPLDPTRDRLILITSSSSSEPIRLHISSVLHKSRHLIEDQSLDDEVINQDERHALSILKAHVKSSWQEALGTDPSDGEFLKLLSLIRVQTLDVEEEGSGELAARSHLRTTVVRDPDGAEQAWAQLISLCTSLAVQRSGADRSELQKTLLQAGFQVNAPPSYQNDINKLKQYSAGIFAALGHLSQIRVGATTIKVQRLSTEILKQAAEDQSILVVGEPGAGKSGALHDLVEGFRAVDQDYLFLAVDRLAATNLPLLRSEIGLDHELLEVLDNWPGLQTGFIVIDGLDAARGDAGGRMIRDLIRAVLERRGRWHVVASIRKFDLRYGMEIKDLFAGSGPTEFQDKEFTGIRHIDIPCLSNDELTQIVSQFPELYNLVCEVSPELKDLLRVPFNLRLMAALLGGGIPIDQLTPIRTRLELLDRYWSFRVIGADGLDDTREEILRKTCEMMVEARALRVDRSAVIGPQSSDSLQELLSRQVLVEWKPSPDSPPNRYILAFSHHVLFDYAVSRLLLRGTPENVVQRLINQPDLSVVVRPSLHLHFEHLWTVGPGREQFWEFVFMVIHAPEIPKINKLIGPSVAAKLAKFLQDLELLCTALENSNPANHRPAEEALGHIVGALLARVPGEESLVGQNAGPWCQLLERISRSLCMSLAFPIQSLLSEICQKPEELTPDQQNTAGHTARRLLGFSWSQKNRNEWLISNALRCVCRTFESDPIVSADLIRRCFDPAHLSQYGFEEMPRLTQEVKRLISPAPLLVEEIYRVAFNNLETSTEPTSMGPSRILPLISNRRQDYEMALYELAEVFPQFLEDAPTNATRALIAVMEFYVAQQHSLSSHEEPEETFDFRGRLAHIKKDFSATWDEGDLYDHDEPMKMLEAFQQYLENLAGQSDGIEKFHSVIELLISKNRLAVLWRRTLLIGSHCPDVYGETILPLSWALPILAGYDTTTPAGEFIKAIFPKLDQEKRERIERAILSIPDSESEDYRDLGEHNRNRLLGCLQVNDLVTHEAKQLLEQLMDEDALPPNEPRVRISTWSAPYGEKEYLRNKGVPTEDAANLRIQELEGPVKEFAKKYLNSTPTLEEASSILSSLKRLYTALSRADINGVDPKQCDYAWDCLTEACAICARTEGLSSEENCGIWVKKVLLEASFHPEPIHHPEYDEGFNEHPSWSSPATRIKSAEGLIVLGRNSTLATSEVTEALKRLIGDPVPPVRYQVARNLNTLYKTAPELMWQLIEKLSRFETSRGVLQALLGGPLQRLLNPHPEQVAEFTQIIFNRVIEGPGAKTVREFCVGIFAILYIWRDQPRSRETIINIATNPISWPNETLNLLGHFRESLTHGPLDPPDPKQDAVRHRALELLEKTLIAACHAFNKIKERQIGNSSGTLPEQEQESARSLARLIHGVGMEVYFSSGAYDNRKQGQVKEIKQQTPEYSERFYREAQTILEELAKVCLPSVTHHLLETLEFFIQVDPRGVFLSIGRVIQSGQQGGYQYESLAAGLIVRLVQRYLADYRRLLREDADCRKTLIEILDVFVQAGWPSARRLTYRLEEIFR